MKQYLDQYTELTYMNFQQVVTLLLESMDFSLSLFLGLFFTLVYNKEKSHLLYLGLFLLAVAFTTGISILESFSAFKELDLLSSIPFNTFIIIPAFLYLYIDKASSLSKSNMRYYLFIPGCIDVLIGFGIILFSENPESFQENGYYSLFLVFLTLLFPIIVFLLFKRIRANTKLVENQYSSLENRDLNWVGYIVISILFYIVLLPFISFFISDFSFTIFDSLFWIFITFWAAYNGLLQQKSPNLIENHSKEEVSEFVPELKLEKNEIMEDSNEADKLGVDHEKNKTIFTKVDEIIKTQELFLNPELTITDVSGLVNEHPRLVSTIINQVGGQNFNSYINLFRVEKAKSLLISDKGKQYSIESIGKESGFKSNSSFYGAFKKNLNQTPSQFMKSNQAS